VIAEQIVLNLTSRFSKDDEDFDIDALFGSDTELDHDNQMKGGLKTEKIGKAQKRCAKKHRKSR
jgi:hypothetical protein